MSVLAKATFPFSGLNLSAGSGSIELGETVNNHKSWAKLMHMPDKGVDLVNGMLNLVIGVDRFDSQFENQPVELVYNKSDLDTLLESMFNDLFCIDHSLELTLDPCVSSEESQNN